MFDDDGDTRGTALACALVFVICFFFIKLTAAGYLFPNRPPPTHQSTR
jgi:hypothetical protein